MKAFAWMQRKDAGKNGKVIKPNGNGLLLWNRVNVVIHQKEAHVDKVQLTSR